MDVKEKADRDTELSKFDPYRLYIEGASRKDRLFVKECNESMDAMMVFAGLFSGAITQFIASTYSLLQPDAQGMSNDLLVRLITVAKYPSTTDISDLNNASTFQPSIQAVAINSLFFFSLILSLLAALGAILVKQLARGYETHGVNQSLPWKQARMREKKRIAMVKWHIEEVIAFIPMLLHIALALFLLGVLIWTSLLSKGSMIPSTILVSIAALLYFGLAAAPSISEDAPFQWPASYGVRQLVQAFQRLASNIPLSNWRKVSPFKPTIGRVIARPKQKTSESDVELGPTSAFLGNKVTVDHPVESSKHASRKSAGRVESISETQPEHNQLIPVRFIASPSVVKKGRSLGTVSPNHQQLPILPDIDTGSVPFIVTPGDIAQSHKEQLYPPTYELLDLVVLINLISDTEVFDALESIFETLRTANWYQINIRDTLVKYGDMMLQRCGSVAATTWYTLGTEPALRDPLRGRARNMALFVEWFYYQLTTEQRRSLRNWPHPGFAHGLLRDIWKDTGVHDHPQVPLDDVLLASSVLAKLHHVQLAEDEPCNRCIVSEDRDEDDIRNRLTLPNFHLPGGKVDIEKRALGRTMQARVSACVSSDTDCLLHYVRSLPGDVLKDRIKASVKVLSTPIVWYIGSRSNETTYEELRKFLKAFERAFEGCLLEEDARSLWFTLLSHEVSEETARAEEVQSLARASVPW